MYQSGWPVRQAGRHQQHMNLVVITLCASSNTQFVKEDGEKVLQAASLQLIKHHSPVVALRSLCIRKYQLAWCERQDDSHCQLANGWWRPTILTVSSSTVGGV